MYRPGQRWVRSLVAPALLLLCLVVVPVAPADRAESRTQGLSEGYLSMGDDFGCALLDDAAVHCWGYNGSGELGLGDNASRGDAAGELPEAAVPLGRPVIALGTGNDHGCALLDDASVHCWGYNVFGQLGLGDGANRGDGPGELPTAAVPLGRAATALSSGGAHSCALLDDGSVHCWGENTYGQLGLGDGASRGDGPAELPTPAVPLGRPAVAVSAGRDHSCALLDDGSVHCWGENSSGQLGVGSTSNRGDGPDELPTPAVPLGRPAVALSGGRFHTCALLDDGTVHCWGLNDYGQLGLGNNSTRGDAPGELPTAAVPLGRAAVAVSSGGYHNCALLDDASVRCWGGNAQGQLGIGDVNPRGDNPGELPTGPVPLNRAAVAVSAGANHSCAMLDDGTVRCWGFNNFGQVGVGDIATRGDAAGELPTPVVPLGGLGRRAADLSLALAASDPARQVGQQVTLTYTLANGGPNRVAGIVTGVGLPGMTIDSATPSQGTFDAASQTWRVAALDRGGVAVLSVVATVRATGTLNPSGEVVAADALDNDSTPANGAAEDDRAAATIAATGQAPPAKVAADALTLKTKAARDLRKPYSYALSGGLVATRAVLADACKGTVAITVKKGKKAAGVANAKLKLSRSAGTCTYTATLKLPSKATAGGYSAVATFPGNAVLESKASKKLVLTAG